MRYVNIFILFLFVLTAAGFLAGCGGLTDGYADRPKIQTDPFIQYSTAGLSVRSEPIELISLGNGTDTILVIAAIHGNEPAGAALAYELVRYLNQNHYLLNNKKLLVVPVANPDGFAQNRRFNANGVDINRNFATDNRNADNGPHGPEALSEPEAKTIHRIIHTCRPSRIVSIHQPYGCIDFDGPAEPLAILMSALCPLPQRKLGAMPGSVGSYTGQTLDIPTITLELPGTDTAASAEQLWEKYRQALLAVIAYKP